MNHFRRRRCHSAGSCASVALSALAWGSFAFGDAPADNTIWIAAQQGDLEPVASLLKMQPTLAFSRDDDGETLLHLAVTSGHMDLVEFLLTNKSDVNARDNDGATPLLLAASYGYEDVVALLLSSKANVNTKDARGNTPLCYAAAIGYKDIVKILLEYKADPDAGNTCYGGTPLHAAARQGNKEAAELLLANRANVNAKARDGQTALHEAAWGGHKDIVELLLTYKADVNARDARGRTPLYEANGEDLAGYTAHVPGSKVAAKHSEVVDVLRQHGGVE